MKYSIEPCHPLGFWGREMQRQVADGDFTSPAAAVRFLELNTLAQIEGSMSQGSRIGARVLHDEEVRVSFLLDDLFASEELMSLMPPTRVAEMISDTWATSAAGAGLPTTCTVVSERSLAVAAAAVVGGSNPAEQVAQAMVENYRGAQIQVPIQAQTHVGEVVPSCPLLAAVWQMWRLGRPIDCADEAIWWGDSLKDADRTLTILNVSLMPVEVAAGVIFDTCDPETRERTSYLFLPEHW